MRRPQPRQLVLAAIIMMVHVCAVVGIFSVKYQDKPSVENAITWVALPMRAKHPDANSQENTKANQMPNLAAPRITMPSIPAVVMSPGDDPAQAVLKDYFLCGLGADENGQRKNRPTCERVGLRMTGVPQTAHAPSDEELKLQRQFSHDLAVQQTPLTAPCFSRTGVGFSIPCVVGMVVNAF